MATRTITGVGYEVVESRPNGYRITLDGREIGPTFLGYDNALAECRELRRAAHDQRRADYRARVAAEQTPNHLNVDWDKVVGR